jgi:outer membrane protein TolC
MTTNARRGFLFVIPLALTAGAAMSATPDLEQSVNLPSLRAYALEQNPEIKAAEDRWRAAQARPSQEGSLPDPMINTAYHNESFRHFTQGTSDFSFLRFGAEQEIPFPGKLGLKETIAEREADREGAMYRATVLNVVTRLRVAYADYFVAYKSHEILQENQGLLTKLEQAAEARYRTGEGLQQDVTRAQLELSILLGRLATVDQARQSGAASLNALLNRPPLAPLGTPAPLDEVPSAYKLDDLEQRARERSPSLQAAELGVARAESKLTLARRQYWPDFVLRADYFNKAELTPEWEVGAGIRIPLYFWRKQAFGVEEAAAGVGEARSSRQAAHEDVLARVKDFHAQAESTERLTHLYRTAVVPQARLSLQSALAGYQVGKVDFLTLLNSFTVLNEYQLGYYEELANHEKAVAQLEEAAGIGPETPTTGGQP